MLGIGVASSEAANTRTFPVSHWPQNLGKLIGLSVASFLRPLLFLLDYLRPLRPLG